MSVIIKARNDYSIGSVQPVLAGVKYDGDKPRMELLPPRALKEVGKVLSFGAKKYAPDNWKKLDNLHRRYIGAALRHITDDNIAPGHLDEESGIDGLAHAICCLMFILEKRLEDAETVLDFKTQKV